jgi:hypothetical protein
MSVRTARACEGFAADREGSHPAPHAEIATGWLWVALHKASNESEREMMDLNIREKVKKLKLKVTHLSTERGPQVRGKANLLRRECTGLNILRM